MTVTRRARGRLVVSVAALGLVIALGVASRSWTKTHLTTMLRDPAAGPGACVGCHLQGHSPRPAIRGPAAEPCSPLALDRDRVLVVATGDGSLYELDPVRGSIRGRIDVGRSPWGVARWPGHGVLVTLRDEDLLVLVDLRSREIVRRIQVGREPSGVAVDPGLGLAVVANTGSDDISLGALSWGGGGLRLQAGREPVGVALHQGSHMAVVTNRLAIAAGPRRVPRSELTILGLEDGPRVIKRVALPGIHMSEAAVIVPDGSLALFPAVATRNLVPTTQVARGWVMSNLLVVQELGGEQRTVPIILDRGDEAFADPGELALDPREHRLYLSSGGTDQVLELDLDLVAKWLAEASPEELAELGTRVGPGSGMITRTFHTAANPRGLALMRGRLVVAERLQDAVSVFELGTGRLSTRIELGAPEGPSQWLVGARLFHRATSFQRQFSCRSCHPEARLDALTYDFGIDGVGENFLDNRSLRGLAGTSPFKWTGINPSLEVQCGPRFVKVLGRGEAFDQEGLEAISTYLRSLKTRNQVRRPKLTDAARRGKEIFYRTHTNSGELIPVKDRCPTCHQAPTFTSRTRADVGTQASTDYTGIFDSPHLLGLRDTAPYLHDGRARTLYEVFTRFNPDDRHGHTSDLTKAQIDDLVEYLETL